MGVLEITAQDFDEQVLQSKIPVLIDMYASWCGPCRVIGKTLERIAPQYAGRAKILKIDIDKNPSIKRQFAVQSIPRMFIFKNGKKVDSILGAVPQATIEQALNKQLDGVVSSTENVDTDKIDMNPLDMFVRPAKGK